MRALKLLEKGKACIKATSPVSDVLVIIYNI